MPQKRTIRAACHHCGAHFLALDNSKAKYCSNACVGRASVRPAGERFWSRVSKTSDCWLWHGIIMPMDANGSGGYGQFSLAKRKLVLAHRYAWEMATGEAVPEGKQVSHACDVRLCVRNDSPGFYNLNGRMLPSWGHLFLGTHLDNMEDARLKGRFLGWSRHKT